MNAIGESYSSSPSKSTREPLLGANSNIGGTARFFEVLSSGASDLIDLITNFVKGLMGKKPVQGPPTEDQFIKSENYFITLNGPMYSELVDPRRKS